MKSQKRVFALTAILTVALLLTLSHISSAQQRQASRRIITFLPMHHFPNDCYPVEVRIVTMNSPPAVLPQIVINSFTPKTVTAVKIGLKAYELNEAKKILATPCNKPLPTPELFLSRTSPLINLGAMFQGDNFSIGITPLPYPITITKTVMTEQPFLTDNDIYKMMSNGDTETVKRDYAVLVFVAEADYDDGAKWLAENN